MSLPTRPLTLLCIGAHADDIEIGCGGTVLQLLERHPGSTVWWVVLSAADGRNREAQESAALMLAGAGGRHVRVHTFADGYFPALYGELKRVFASLQREVAPDLVFTHYREDRHQDHRTLSDLTWQTFRDHLILEYEIPKYDGDLGSPGIFVPLTEAVYRRKVAHVLDAFPSQRDKHWFTAETFEGLMRLRGVECAAPGGYAEAFHARKAILAT